MLYYRPTMIFIYTFYFKSRCVEMVLKDVFVVSSDSWGCCPSFLGLPLLACFPGFVFGFEHSAQLRPLWFKPGDLWDSPDLALRAYLLPEALTSIPACCVPGLQGIPHSLALKVNIFKAKPGTFLSHILNFKGLAHGPRFSVSVLWNLLWSEIWVSVVHFLLRVLISRICFCSNAVF